MNPYAIPPLITSILFLVTGAYVYLYNKKSSVNSTFALEWLAVFIWQFGYFIAYSIHDKNAALLWIKILYIGVVFLPSIFYHFVMELLKKKSKNLIVLNYFMSLAFIGSIFFTKKFISGTHTFYWGFQPKVEFLHNVFVVYFSIIYLRCYLLLYGAYNKIRNTYPREYIRIKYIFWAYIVATCSTTDFIANYGIEWYPLGFIFITIGFMTINYAIVRHRLMDINIVFTRAGIFIFVYLLILAVPFVIRDIVRRYMSHVFSYWWAMPILSGIVLASAGPFIYMYLQRRLEARLRAKEFRSHEALRRLSHNMLRFTNLNILLRLMTHYLVKVLRLKFTAIYLFNSQLGRYVLSSVWYSGKPVDLPQEFEDNSYLVEHLSLKKLPIVTEELSLYDISRSNSKSLSATLSHLRINTIIPSFLKSGLIGFLVLSDRRDNIPFTQEDLNLLMVLSNEAALAIENAQFHQKEVSELVEKSKREALADMAPGASHQFNNRLASISSSVELMLLKMENFNIGACQDENIRLLLKDAKDALELIDKEVYKGKEITSAILKRAKAKVEFQEFNLISLIENTYKLVMISRSRSGLDKARELKFNMLSLSQALNIFASEALLQDVFYNLIDNAYDAIQDKARLANPVDPSFQGEIEVSVSQEDHIIVAKVRDNGIGLTKENQRKLFTPYFTTKATSNKGTGLGLCVIRDFIEMHKGAVSCDSEYGKGSTFTIKLPIRKEK